MPQSIAYNYIHVTFSTFKREPLIKDSIKDELYSYIGGICKNLECNPIKVGGHKDHIHILCLLSKKVALITLLEELKKSSSRWMKSKGQAFKDFYWQNGYGAFSVNPSQIDIVTNYIETQEIHHRKTTFKDEYLAFLKKYHVDYDERYLWD